MLLQTIKAYRPWISPRELPYTALAVLWFAICIYLTSLSNAYMDIRYRNLFPSTSKRLPDTETLPDPMVAASTSLLFARIPLCGRLAATVLRRVLYVCGFVFLLRAISITLTVLPNPLLTCHAEPNPNIFYDALILALQQRPSCGDLFFSGHTIMFMLSCLLWYDYRLTGTSFDWIVRIFFVIWGIICHLILIISSFHYTIDVLVSICVTIFFWKAFNYLATTHTFDGTYLSRLVLYLDQERYTQLSKLEPIDQFP